MTKRFLSMLLCAALLLSMAVPVLADEAQAPEDSQPKAEAAIRELSITTAEEFLTFAESCRLDSYSQNLTVSLEADIDLGGMSFAGIPIFSGMFLGNGHTVSNVSITAGGSEQGFFRRLTDTAVVQDLHVRGDIHPGGSRSEIGGIAGSNAGLIRNCSFDGTLSGADSVGGIAGTNRVTGIIEECTVYGRIHGSHFIGGVAGKNYGVIRGCENRAAINTTAQQNEVELSDITIDTLTGAEAANTVTDIGGIAGASHGVIRASENYGNVGYQLMGYNIGGIAGTQSGYITGCVNYADILGRKEVGGIVGQMEPVARIEYSEDALQILREQLAGVSGMVNQASANAQANASQVTGQIGQLRDQAQTAQDAVASLIPDEENPQLPDMDSVLAAQNTLSSTLDAMPDTVRGIASAAQNTVSGLNRDLQAISGQLNALGAAINSASEHVGGSIADVSDADTAQDLTGKVELCVNSGSVLGDLNVGGIAGAIAMENDLDILEDWETSGEESMNFASELRAVVLGCENSGTVTGKKQNAGGIAGWQSMGLVKNSVNTGTVDGQNADCVGGISGLSTGFIRHSYAKCEIAGASAVGGIAGSASVVSDCRSMVKLLHGSEKLGAILGAQTESDLESPVCGNYYLCVSSDPGAIDGISYDGAAQPLVLDEFLALEGLPELFSKISVSFLFADGTQEVVTVTPGGALEADSIPELPEMAGFTGRWEGLADAQLDSVLFDMTFQAVYTAYSSVSASSESRDGKPLLLIEGDFTPEAAVTLQSLASTPVTENGTELLESCGFTVTNCVHTTAARYLLPEGVDAQRLVLYVHTQDGQWRQSEFSVDGSYIAFAIECGDDGIALAQTEQLQLPWYLAAGAAAVVIVLLATVAIVRKKKAQKPQPQESEEPITQEQ